MKKSIKTNKRSLSTVFFLIVMALAKAGAAAEHTTNVDISPEHFENLGVVLGELEPSAQIPLLTAPAIVAVPPAHEYVVTASESGLITRLTASIGDRVDKGEVLAELNSPNLLSLQRQYLKAESDLQLALLSYRRDKKLFEEGVISERRWQDTKSQYNVYSSSANEYRQLLEIAGMSGAEIARLKNTRKLSGQLNVQAPISGTVLDRMKTAGSRVDTLAPLYRVANLDQLWLEISLPQERAAEVAVGDRVIVDDAADTTSEDALDGENPGVKTAPTVTAKISMVSRNVNTQNQTVLARAVIDGRQPAVRPGQRFNIRIIRAAEQPSFRVPNTAIAQNEGQAYVFVRNRDGFQVTPVQVVGKEGDESLITGKFEGSEQIALKGVVALKANWLGLGKE